MYMKKERRFRFVEGMMRRRIKYVGERPAQKHTTPSPSFVMHKITILFRPRDITAAAKQASVMTRSLSDFGQVKSSELSRAKAMPAPNFKGKEGERHRRSELRIWLFRSGSDSAVQCLLGIFIATTQAGKAFFENRKLTGEDERTT